MTSINERLAQILLIEKNKTPYQIGKEIGTSTQNVDNWLNKKVMPGADWLGEICRVYNINPTYALFNKGSKYTNIITNSKTENSIAAEPEVGYKSLGDKDAVELKLLRELIDVYRKSNNSYEKDIQDLTDKNVKLSNEIQKLQHKKPSTR